MVPNSLFGPIVIICASIIRSYTVPFAEWSHPFLFFLRLHYDKGPFLSERPFGRNQELFRPENQPDHGLHKGTKLLVETHAVLGICLSLCKQLISMFGVCLIQGSIANLALDEVLE